MAYCATGRRARGRLDAWQLIKGSTYERWPAAGDPVRSSLSPGMQGSSEVNVSPRRDLAGAGRASVTHGRFGRLTVGKTRRRGSAAEGEKLGRMQRTVPVAGRVTAPLDVAGPADLMPTDEIKDGGGGGGTAQEGQASALVGHSATSRSSSKAEATKQL